MTKKRTRRVSRKSVKRVSKSSLKRSKRNLRKSAKRKSAKSKSAMKLLKPIPEPMVKKSKKKSKKGPSPYNKFVKEMSPKLRKANPGLKQPQIMKLIAEEWRKMPIPETD